MEILTLEKLKSNSFSMDYLLKLDFSDTILSFYKEFTKELIYMVHVNGINQFTMTQSHRVGVVLLLIKCGFTVKNVIADIENIEQKRAIQNIVLTTLDHMDFVTFTLEVNL